MTPHIDVIPPEAAEGRLKAIYADAAGRRGSVANVLQIHSLRPETLRTHLDLYLSIMFSKSGLSRQEREVIAVVVSHANECSYCVAHHAAALSRYQTDEKIVDEISRHGISESMTDRESSLATYAASVTMHPSHDASGRVERLRQSGFDDEEILTATTTAAYFNFVNRMVLALGVEMEAAHEPSKYRY